MSTFPKFDLLGDAPEPEPREPIYDRLTFPPLSEQSVRVCPWCGEATTGRLVGECEVVECCPNGHGIMETDAATVPASVYEEGPEAVLEYLG